MRKNLILVTSLLLMLAVVVLAAACGGGTTTTTAPAASTTSATEATATTVPPTTAPAGEIKIGAAIPLSGFAADYGKEAQQGMQLAVEQINSAGGIGGSQVKLLVEDSAADAKTAVSATQKLLSVDKVVGMVGTMFTSEALPEAPLLTKAKIPSILGQANSPAIPSASPYIFMPHPTSQGDVETVTNYAFKVKNVKKLAFLGPDNDFSRGATVVAKQAYDTLGGQLVLSKLYPADTTDFKTLLTEVKGSGADGLYMNGSSQDISRIIRQASELGMKLVWMGSSQLGDKSIIAAVGNLAEGAFYAEAAPKTDAGKKTRADFLAAYTQKYNGAPATVTPYYAYDTLNLMVAALKAVGTDGTTIKDWLTALTDYTGATGEISFNGSNVASASMFITEVQAGKFVQTDFSMVVK